MAHKKVTFEGWKNCLEISSGKLKLIVATEIGPRILGAFYDKSPNLFCIYPQTAGKTGGNDWNPGECSAGKLSDRQKELLREISLYGFFQLSRINRLSEISLEAFAHILEAVIQWE